MTNPPPSPHHGLHPLQHPLLVGRLRPLAPPGRHLHPPPLPMPTMLLHVALGPSGYQTSHQLDRTWVGNKPNSRPNPLICVLALLDHKRRSEGIMEPSALAMSQPAGTLLTNLWTGCAQVAPNCSLSVPRAQTEKGLCEHPEIFHPAVSVSYALSI